MVKWILDAGYWILDSGCRGTGKGEWAMIAGSDEYFTIHHSPFTIHENITLNF